MPQDTELLTCWFRRIIEHDNEDVRRETAASILNLLAEAPGAWRAGDIWQAVRDTYDALGPWED